KSRYDVGKKWPGWDFRGTNFEQSFAALAPAGRPGSLGAVRRNLHSAALLLGAPDGPAAARCRRSGSGGVRRLGAKAARVSLRPRQEFSELAPNGDHEQ